MAAYEFQADCVYLVVYVWSKYINRNDLEFFSYSQRHGMYLRVPESTVQAAVQFGCLTNIPINTSMNSSVVIWKISNSSVGIKDESDIWGSRPLES